MFKNTARPTQTTAQRLRAGWRLSTATYRWLAALLAASLSCNFLTQGLPAAVGSGDFSVEATSPVSVNLAWKAVSGASGYKLEARYGTDFFPVADLPGDQTSYEHFVVPGSPEITYRLSAGDEIGTVTVTMPELATNPLKVGFVQSTPALPTMPGFDLLTPDPNNPDPGAIPTFDPNTLPSFDPNDSGSFDPSAFFKPVSVTQEIGPEGGTVTMTSPAGATFTLEVPPGALRETVPLTLSPMESIAEAPLPFEGGLLAAVQIRPVIPFEPTLTLRIQLAPEAPLPDAALVAGFAASGMSDELALQPIESDGNHAYTMRVDWGDTFGLAAATPEEIAEQVKRVPADAGAQMAQMVAATQLLAPPGTGDTTVLADQILEALFAQTARIAARHPAKLGMEGADYAISASLGVDATGDRQRSVAAQQLRTTIERTRESFYMYQGGGRATELLARLASLIKTFISRVDKQCLTEDALYAQEIITNLQKYAPDPASEFRFTGNAFWAALWTVYGPVQDLKPCSITLDIQSSTILSEDQFGSVKTVASTTTPITLELVFEGDQLRLRGVGPVDYTEYEIFDKLCPPAKRLSDVPSTSLWITNLQPLFNPDDGRLVDFVLHRTMSDPFAFASGIQANVTASPPAECRVLSLAITKPSDYWGLGFSFLHNSNPDQNWNIQLGDAGLTATKSVTRGVQNITETSTLVIEVRPSP